jgi:aryl-alcohol dehydrogenase-like predicted oxidoreductase
MNCGRRDFNRALALAVGAHCSLPAWATAIVAPTLMRRRLPGRDESLPVIGLGSSGNFEVGADAAARGPLREVLAAFVAAGGTVLDTSPNYSSAEDVLGDLIGELGVASKLFIATKLAAEGRSAGFAQFAQSLKRLRVDRVDLLQVHNLRDWRTQVEVARELQARAAVRYVGLTHYLEHAHGELAAAMRSARPDFVQVNFSLAERGAEHTILPLAAELGIAVLVNRAFEDSRLFERVRGRSLPASARDLGIGSWSQLFLKFVLAHPAVTCVIPATSKPRHLHENLLAGAGPLPDAATRESWVRALN